MIEEFYCTLQVTFKRRPKTFVRLRGRISDKSTDGNVRKLDLISNHQNSIDIENTHITRFQLHRKGSSVLKFESGIPTNFGRVHCQVRATRIVYIQPVNIL